MRLKEIKPGMVIHCKTKEEATTLHAELCRLGNMSTDLDTLLNFINANNLYYAILDLNAKTWRFSNKYEFETKNGIEFSDLIIPELSAKEVLETIGEICTRSVCCTSGDGCPLYRSGNQNLCSNKMLLAESSKVIDICTKWREEHPKEEKKELETEWVYVVRIIKVHDNGKKECVSEIEAGESRDGIEDKIERGLKLYSENHKGNFFATLEHICRIKE